MALQQTPFPFPDLQATLDVSEKPAEPEVVSLTLPHEARFLHVARIVIGGLAARLELSYENLVDLQLAVETLIAPERYRVSEAVTVEISVSVADREVEILVGPLDGDRVVRDLEEASEAVELPLNVVLAAVVDTIQVEERDEAEWVRLAKRVAIPSG
jgi:hypothetical protein